MGMVMQAFAKLSLRLRLTVTRAVWVALTWVLLVVLTVVPGPFKVGSQ